MDSQILTPKDIGNLVREARKLQGLTQADAAAISGTNRRFISELESGKATSQIGKTIAVLSALGIGLYGSSKWKGKL